MRVENEEVAQDSDSEESEGRDAAGSQISKPLSLPCLELGWPDGVALYKHGAWVDVHLAAWGACEEISGRLESTPMRASFNIGPLREDAIDEELPFRTSPDD